MARILDGPQDFFLSVVFVCFSHVRKMFQQTDWRTPGWSRMAVSNDLRQWWHFWCPIPAVVQLLWDVYDNSNPEKGIQNLRNGGVHSHGGTPIAGWFFFWGYPIYAKPRIIALESLIFGTKRLLDSTYLGFVTKPSCFLLLLVVTPHPLVAASPGRRLSEVAIIPR